MPKLVRDKIPEIMRANNQSVKIKILENEEEYFFALKAKLLEEIEEFFEAVEKGDDHNHNAKEEIADILEVLGAICALKKYNFNEIQKIKIQKLTKRGGFEGRVFLE